MFVFCLDNAASEGVLASFFNSLLSKKTGSPGSPCAGGVQSTAKKSGIASVTAVCSCIFSTLFGPHWSKCVYPLSCSVKCQSMTDNTMPKCAVS